ncbi:MAG: citrate transporter [Acidobacteria bacterium]|nr:citrate transporter [Acidobacteriota bacterium]
MTAALLLAVFALFAALMLLRKLPALLAVPCMAATVAMVVREPLAQWLSLVIADGAVRLAPAYVAVCAGAMLGRVMMSTGIAEDVIRRAAEFGGDRPMVVAAVLMSVTAVLFTSLTGLGAIIMVGSLVLPIMMSLGVPRRLAAILFLLAFATGFIFNIALWRLYRELLQVAPAAALPREIVRFASALALVMTAVVGGYATWAASRAPDLRLWAASLPRRATRVPAAAYLTPFVPLVLYVGFGWREVPAFLAGALYGIVLTRPRALVQTLLSAMIRGVEDAAPAVLLMAGIGMLLNALTLPAVRVALAPLVSQLPVQTPLSYVLFFTLLSPLALYRGPLNPFGVGVGVYSLMLSSGLLPPLALLAAIMSVGQVQNVCDPTNTHNVWVASYTGVRVEEISRATLLPMMLVCLGGLLLGAWWFL